MKRRTEIIDTKELKQNVCSPPKIRRSEDGKDSNHHADQGESDEAIEGQSAEGKTTVSPPFAETKVQVVQDQYELVSDEELPSEPNGDRSMMEVDVGDEAVVPQETAAFFRVKDPEQLGGGSLSTAASPSHSANGTYGIYWDLPLIGDGIIRRPTSEDGSTSTESTITRTDREMLMAAAMRVKSAENPTYTCSNPDETPAAAGSEGPVPPFDPTIRPVQTDDQQTRDLICQTCGFEFQLPYALEYHEKCCGEVVRLQCKFCSLWSCHTISLRRHLRRCHGKEIQPGEFEQIVTDIEDSFMPVMRDNDEGFGRDITEDGV